MYRAVVACVIAASGCGSRCKDVDAARALLLARRGAPERTADVRVTVPFERANAFLGEALREPLAVPLDVPAIGPIEIALPKLAAAVREVPLQPGPPGKVRFAATIV